MTPYAFYTKFGKERSKVVAEAAGTTFENFQQIALYGGSVSAKLAERLEVASGKKMTRMEILYPESRATG
jgi:hypothetical protein